MIKKVIAFNRSPRKGWNTDQLIKKFLEGAKSAGAEVKLYEELYYKIANGNFIKDLNSSELEFC